jgi:hypothetical protein
MGINIRGSTSLVQKGYFKSATAQKGRGATEMKNNIAPIEFSDC